MSSDQSVQGLPDAAQPKANPLKEGVSLPKQKDPTK